MKPISKEIEDELKEAGAHVLLSIDRTRIFSAPADYFSTLPGVILSNITDKESEDEYEPGMLRELASKNPFSVPEGYFSGLAEKISQNIISEQNTAKVIPIHQPRKTRWKNYLVAASVAALAGIFGFFAWQSGTFNNIAGVTAGSAANLEDIPDESLDRYLTETAYLSPGSIEISDINIINHSFIPDADNLEVLLGDIPEEDLVYYSKDML